MRSERTVVDRMRVRASRTSVPGPPACSARPPSRSSRSRRSAIGIGANAAIFGAINGLLLKPLQVRDAGSARRDLHQRLQRPALRRLVLPRRAWTSRAARRRSQDLAVADVDRAQPHDRRTAGTALRRARQPELLRRTRRSRVAAGQLPRGALDRHAACAASSSPIASGSAASTGTRPSIGRAIRVGREPATIVARHASRATRLAAGSISTSSSSSRSTAARAGGAADRGRAVIGRLRAGRHRWRRRRRS